MIFCILLKKLVNNCSVLTILNKVFLFFIRDSKGAIEYNICIWYFLERTKAEFKFVFALYFWNLAKASHNNPRILKIKFPIQLNWIGEEMWTVQTLEHVENMGEKAHKSKIEHWYIAFYLNASLLPKLMYRGPPQKRWTYSF